MANPIIMKRVVAAPGNLPRVAVQDGASIAYAFNKAAGTAETNLGSAGSSYDIPNANYDAQVARQVAAAGYPDRYGNKFIETDPGAGNPYGHVAVIRPSQNGHTKVCYEVVFQCDKDNVPTARTLIEQRWEGVLSVGAVFFGTDGALHTLIALAGGYDQAWGTITANGQCRRFVHLVYQYDGTDYTGWFNGVRQFTVTTGIGAATMSDDGTPSNMYTVFGGIHGSGSENIGATVAFYAQYSNQVLTSTQIATHAKNAGIF